MVRKYKKKKERSWSEEDLKVAVLAVCDGGEKCKRVAESFGIPRSTLQGRIKIYKKNNSLEFAKPGVKTLFTAAQEKFFVDTILYHQLQLVGYTSHEIRSLAYELAEKLKLKHKFDDSLKLAGQDWFDGFMARHPELSLRKPEHTSVARAEGFNKQSVNEFFDILEASIKKYNITPDCIYNVDETPVPTVPKSTSKVVGAKGQKQVGGLVSAERGEHVTAEICFSATGNYMPPTLIFPRARPDPKYYKGAPPGAKIEFHSTGYVQMDIFHRWMLDFIKFSKPNPQKYVLLTLDNHSTHIRNWEALDAARENNVIIIGFPPHTTHRLQPVDVSFNKPLSQYFSVHHAKWMRQHGSKGLRFGLRDYFDVFTPAYQQAATVENAVNGFKAAGINPFNRNVFPDSAFVVPRRLSISGE